MGSPSGLLDTRRAWTHCVVATNEITIRRALEAAAAEFVDENRRGSPGVGLRERTSREKDR